MIETEDNDLRAQPHKSLGGMEEEIDTTSRLVIL